MLLSQRVYQTKKFANTVSKAFETHIVYNAKKNSQLSKRMYLEKAEKCTQLTHVLC